MSPPELRVGDWVNVTVIVDQVVCRAIQCRVGAVLPTRDDRPLLVVGPAVRPLHERLAEVRRRHGGGDYTQIALPPDPDPYYLTVADGEWIVCDPSLNPIPYHSVTLEDPTHA